jgi:beclin 1
MSQLVKCLDCNADFTINYECCSEICQSPLENDEDILKKIKEIEELTNFNVKKNICLNCLDKLIKERESTNFFLTSEKDALTNALESLINEIEAKDFINMANFPEEELLVQEKEAESQLASLKTREKECEEELQALTETLVKLSEEENDYWNNFNDLERNIYLYEKSKSMTKNKINTYEKEIKNFSNTSVFADLFNISFSDKYGTINGSRMGALSGSNVLYDEINSGWGYIIFLTSIIAKKFNYEFKKYDLVPMGNFSKIINPTSKLNYELTMSSNTKVIEKFNESMVVYLENLKELSDYLLPILNNKTSGDFSYIIQNDCINKCSIKFDQNNPENWSQCMKYLLTILKFFITGVLKKEDDDYKEILEKSSIINNK